MRLRGITILAFALAIFVPLLGAPTPAQANIASLTLHRRSCNVVSVYLAYDGFAGGGSAPYYAVFAADLDGNGVFGETGEPKVFKQVKRNGQPLLVNARLYFKAREGSTIAVTAYEIDSTGTYSSGQLAPVSYECTNRPVLSPLPADTTLRIPGVAVTAKIILEKVDLYSEPTTESIFLGGVGIGQVFDVRALNTRGDWALIDVGGGKQGWIMWQYQAYLLGPYQSLPRR
ncbi:MAG TPA: hypothetical protein PLD47_14225 [Aggregatilineales bacterium]|nr:hypothetical protein [Anaerolineales bacterium]HRE48879.1 hypothetical protein [Aggregatilineales bacterium]